MNQTYDLLKRFEESRAKKIAQEDPLKRFLRFKRTVDYSKNSKKYAVINDPNA